MPHVSSTHDAGVQVPIDGRSRAQDEPVPVRHALRVLTIRAHGAVRDEESSGDPSTVLDAHDHGLA